jgi:protein-tyrosine phosphatase
MRPEQFHLLFVCTANICRSPIAVELTRLKLRTAARSDARHVHVSSAGIHGHDGAAMDPRAVAVLGSLGAFPADFSARTLTTRLMVAADLVLTAQRLHRAAVVRLHPGSHAKSFTILQFARLVRHVDPGRLAEDGVVPRARSLVREAARLRGGSPSPIPIEDDIADPYSRPIKDFRACAAAIDMALDRPLRLILA